MEGIGRLARVLQERMHAVNEKPPMLDYGEIQGDMSLLTNYFPKPIPQGDYMVCRSVTWGAVDAIFYQTQKTGIVKSGEHQHITSDEPGNPVSEPMGSLLAMQHVHDVLIGPKYRWLAPGDRVLVAWVGDDACVVDIVYPATLIG